MINLAETGSDFDLTNWTDGFTISTSRIYCSSIIEIGNSSDYATADKVYQEPIYLSDGSVQIKANLTGLGSGPYYLWVTNNQQERSAPYPLSGTRLRNAGNPAGTPGFSTVMHQQGVDFLVGLPSSGDFFLSALDIYGRRVWQHSERNAMAGSYAISRPSLTGMYIIVLKQNDEEAGRKMLFIR
jgi:hypothetical protein